MKLKDGSILSSNLGPGYENLAGYYNINVLYVGQVNEVLYVDHPRNRSKRFVEYDILINERGITSTLYRNCREMDSFGSENNFTENVLQPVTDGKRGRKDDTEPYRFRNGSIVVIGFLNGHKESPVILGCLPHPNLRLQSDTNIVIPEFNGTGTSVSRDERLKELPTLLPGSKESGSDNDGTRLLGEFQGLRWNINKDGELTIVYQGPKNAKGQLTNTTAQPTIIKINKDGEFFVLDNLDQEIKISRKDKKILISSGNDPADYIEISREQKSITHSMTNDEIHNIGRDNNITTKRNKNEKISGQSNTSVGGDEINKVDKRRIENISGTWRVTTGGETVFTSPKIKIGSDGSVEPLVLGNQWVLYTNTQIVATLNALITAFNTFGGQYSSHTHSGVDSNGDSVTTGGPSGGAAPGGPSPAATAGAAQLAKKSVTE